MKRFFAGVLALVVLQVAGCKKDEPAAPPTGAPTGAPTAQNEQAPREAPDAPEGDPGAEAEGGDEEEEVKIDAEVVERYLAYWEADIDLTRKEMEEAARLKSAKADPTLAEGVKLAEELEDIYERAEQRRAALRKQHNLTEAQTEKLQGAVVAVVGVNAIAPQAEVNKALAEMRKQLDGLPPEQRAVAEKDLASMQSGVDSLAAHEDARQDYGDATVDAILVHEQKAQSLFKKSVGMKQPSP